MTKRVKKEVLTPISASEAEDVMSTYAEADAQIEQITAKMDEQITKIREKYADDLALREELKNEALDKLQLFAETNKGLFEKRRSMEMVHGKIGFRTGTPKLKTMKGFTWAAITKLLEDKMPHFVRTTNEPNKEMLLEMRDKPEVAKRFEDVGILVVQDETFFVELKKEAGVKMKVA